MQFNHEGKSHLFNCHFALVKSLNTLGGETGTSEADFLEAKATVT